MESTRQNKVARLIQKDLGEIIQQLGKPALQGRMVTVTVVRMSPDLSVAKIYLSIFPSEERLQYLEHLKQYNKIIRNQLGQRVKNQLRIVPELVFFIDDSLDYVEKIDQLLKK
jgi:ribosome-binding factor A